MLVLRLLHEGFVVAVVAGVDFAAPELDFGGEGGAALPGLDHEAVQHALGDVPLVGFFASGEIARNQLYGYTGVLTVFTALD